MPKLKLTPTKKLRETGFEIKRAEEDPSRIHKSDREQRREALGDIERDRPEDFKIIKITQDDVDEILKVRKTSMSGSLLLGEDKTIVWDRNASGTEHIVIEDTIYSIIQILN